MSSSIIFYPTCYIYRHMIFTTVCVFYRQRIVVQQLHFCCSALKKNSCEREQQLSCVLHQHTLSNLCSDTDCSTQFVSFADAVAQSIAREDSMSLLIVILLCSGCIVCRGSCGMEESWQQWKQEHKKSYDSIAEEAARKEIWKQTYHRIAHHNSAQNKFFLSMNQFSDLVTAQN